jgi:uncharacterized protein (DUF2141 family)
MKMLDHPARLVRVLFFAAAVILPADGFGAGETVSVTVNGLRNVKGHLLASLFSKADGFPARPELAMQALTLNITGRMARVTFTNVPPGVYAVAVCHDENSDGRMNSRFFGRPKEGYGLYRPTDIQSGPPRFKGSEFAVGTNRIAVDVEMIYPVD